jgi:N utilization substance protein A
MATGIAANRLELLQIADAVAREKSIDKNVVIHAMEEAMQRAAKSRYGSENEIRVEIDPKTGETHISRYLNVVEKIEDDKKEISLTDARRRNPAAQPGDIIAETLPPIEFSRIATQAAKQVIVQKVRDAERERQYEEYKDRIGEIVHGTVKRVEFGSVVVDFGRAEGVVRRDEMIPRETFRNGDRIRAYIYDVRRETRGPQIFLSRTHPQFMARLFAQEVPEIYDGIIEIRAVARDPGSRAKIAVISKDSSIDPVGACVGMRGVRVQAVVQELQGERIDIIPWVKDDATFIVNALAPAEVSKVVLDEDTRRVEVVVPDDQLSLAIGRRGQNVRLASQLTNSPNAPRSSWRVWTWTRPWRNCLPRKVSQMSKTSPMCRRMILPKSKALTKKPPKSFRPARSPSSKSAMPLSMRSAGNLASMMMSQALKV